MKRRILVILLVCTLVAAMASCADSGSKGTVAPTTAATASGSNATATPAATVEAVNKWALPYQGDEVHIALLGWETYSKINPDNMFGKWYQEQLGNLYVDFEIPAEDTSTKIELYLSSGDMPDILLYRGADKFMANYGDGSRTLNLLDFSEYMPGYTARRESYPHLSWYDVDESTTYLFFPCWYDAPSEVWFMNQDLMDKYKLQTPTNYEEMVACMATVCAGEENVDGMALIPWGFDYMFRCFATLFGSKYIYPSQFAYDYNQGKWVYSLYGYEDAFHDATVAMAEAYDAGYLNPDFITWDATTYDTKRFNGEWLFSLFYDNITKTQYNNTFTCKVTYIDPPAAKGVTPFIKTDYKSDTTGWAFVVSSATKYPELCCEYLDFISSETYAQTYYWGFEDETYAVKKDGTKSFLESYISLTAEEESNKYGLQDTYAIQPFASNFYAPDAITALFCDETNRSLNIIAQKLASGEYEAYYSMRSPNFDDATKDQISTISNALSTYVIENLTAFVLGNRDLSEWDSFITGLADYGDIDWVLEQYNSAVQKAAPASQFERTYLVP